MGDSVSGLVSSRRGSLLFRKASIIARLITIALHAAGGNVSRYLPQEGRTWNFLLRFFIVIPGNEFVIFLCDFCTRFMKVNACIWDRVCSRYLSLKLIHPFIHKCLYSLLGPGLLFFHNHFTPTVGHLGRVISPSQGRYQHRWQHEHRINAHTNIHASNGIRTHDPSVRAGEGSSCLRPRVQLDRLVSQISIYIFIKYDIVWYKYLKSVILWSYISWNITSV
jgi:hypothetical protein